MQKFKPFLVLSATLLSLAGCNSASTPETSDSPPADGKKQPVPLPTKLPVADRQAWLSDTTVSLRGTMHVPGSSELFALPDLRAQQLVFDPGAALHCQIEQDSGFQAAATAAGGVQWGYSVSVLDDQSKPRVVGGFSQPQEPRPEFAAAGGAAAPVEIAEADIVGVSDQAALYYTPGHGLLLVDLTGATPKLSCGALLPGQVKKFYLYQDHLIALVETWPGVAEHHAFLLHLQVKGASLAFVENVDLGDVSILDSRRFNDQLVVYGAFSMPTTMGGGTNGSTSGGGVGLGGGIAFSPVQAAQHRSLQVFKIGAKMTPAMHDTLLDTHKSTDYALSNVDKSTQVGTEVNREESFGQGLFASDHYFVVTDAVHKTFFDGFQTETYQVCTKSHTVDSPYQSCTTQYKTVPNPDYTPPETPGGDRGCNGQTLSDCLQQVAKVSNPTIEVPVGVKCVDATYTQWYCDTYEQRQTDYPTFHGTDETKLFIYAYTDTGFVRFSDQASTLDPSLQNAAPGSSVATVNTGSATHELLIEGAVQTLQFQNGYLYAIANQQLLTYAVNGSSLVQTSSVTGTSDSLQSSLFTNDKLYLSDYKPGYYSGQDPSSVLRVFDLSNPAFPKQASTDRTLPGGHDAIFAVREGIFTLGRVDRFQNTDRSFLKVGLFGDPFTDEKSYSIIGTDLSAPAWNTGMDKTYYFDPNQERLFLPYWGRDLTDPTHNLSRVDVSVVGSDKVTSEGGVDLPETPERVRPIPTAAPNVLTFAPNSIELLAPGKPTWQMTDVFAYFRPVALYRLDDADDYAEVLKLGNQCKLRITTQGKINELAGVDKLAPFDCYSEYVTAYAHNLLFTQTQGVSFDDAGNVKKLSMKEVTDLYTAINARLTCVLDPTIVADPAVDPLAKQDLSKVQCYTPDELGVAQTAAQQQAAPVPGSTPGG